MSQVVMEGLDLSMDELMGHMMSFAMKETFAPAEPTIQAFTPSQPGADTLRPHVETDGSFYGSLGLFAQNLQQVQFMLRFFDEWMREESERSAGVEFGMRKRLDRMEETLKTLNERVDSLAGTATMAEIWMIRQMEDVRQTLEAQKAMLEGQQMTIEGQMAMLEGQRVTIEAQQATIEGQQALLENQRVALERQQAAFETQQAAFETQQSVLEAQKTALETQRTTLDAHQKQLDEQPQILPFKPHLNGNGNGHSNGNGNGNGHANGHVEGNDSENGAGSDPKNKWVLLPISSLWKK